MNFNLKLKLTKLLRIKLLLCATISLGQNLEKIGKSSLFKLTGGVGVNSVFYEGSSNREPFTYFLSGNVNLNISDVYNIPFSFSYSNAKFQTNNPFSFNRFSIHPSYKWVTAHIGDINMTFSPYTLNGHQFTGIGFDLSPKEKLKISLMYGRLLREREYDVNNLNGEANYRRIGYGIKASYKFDKFTLGGIFFKAKDVIESLKERVPIENEVQPKDNTVISVNGEFEVLKGLKLKGEVALSALTEDVRGAGTQGFMSSLLNTNLTTQYYKAYNMNFTYQVGKGNIGIRYEFIDPNYRTLGGYFFNNDLENVTINASQQILNDKLGITLNVGLQRDDLDGDKASQLKRLVSALNLNYNASKKLNLTFGYSNFQSYTNIKNQFDYINGISQIEEDLDRANITQISQNANLNANYILSEDENKRENINAAITFQDAENRIGEERNALDQSTLYNGNLAYTVGYPKRNLSISGAVNASLSKISESNNVIFGPTISASKSFFQKKLKLNGSLGYNQSSIDGEDQGNITNFRVSSRYVYRKRHNFSLNGLAQLRNSLSNSREDFTITFGYTYRFGVFDSKNIRFKRKAKTKTSRKTKKTKLDKNLIRFTFKDSLYEGTIEQIDYRIERLIKAPDFAKVPETRKSKFQKNRIEIAKEKNKRAYKIKAIQLLKEIYDSKAILDQYYRILFNTIKELQLDAKRLDYAMESQYVKNKKEGIKHLLWNKSENDRREYSDELQEEYKEIDTKLKLSLDKLLTHRWISKEIQQYKTIDDVKEDKIHLREFYNKTQNEIFDTFENERDKRKIRFYILQSVIEFFGEKSQKYLDRENFKLKYF